MVSYDMIPQQERSDDLYILYTNMIVKKKKKNYPFWEYPLVIIRLTLGCCGLQLLASTRSPVWCHTHTYAHTNNNNKHSVRHVLAATTATTRHHDHTNNVYIKSKLSFFTSKNAATSSCSNPGVASAIVRLSQEYNKWDIYSFIYTANFRFISSSRVVVNFSLLLLFVNKP